MNLVDILKTKFKFDTRFFFPFKLMTCLKTRLIDILISTDAIMHGKFKADYQVW